jgi:hypothetical protein
VAELVRFVDSIATTPGLRLNLFGGMWNTLASSAFPPPRLKRAEVRTLLFDGAQYPASSYDDRTVILNLQLQAPDADTAATQLQLLHRELTRPNNFLQWQADGSSHPVFFPTKRADTTGIETIRPKGGLIELTVEIPAGPFALGTKQTLSPIAVTNNPATSCFFDVTSVKGDVETPLIMSIEYGDVSGKGPAVFGVRREGTPANVPFFIQCESMTQGTNTSVSANDAVMSGAGSNYSTCTFGTATLQERLTSATHPSSASVDARGMYRVFLRVRRTSATGTIAVQLKQTSGTSTATNTKVTLPATTDRRWIDLGVIQIPFGYDPVSGIDGVEYAARGHVFSILAERTVAGSNLDFDVLCFMPADDRMCFPSFPTSSGATSMILDGTVDGVFPLGSSNEVYARELIGRDGGLPLLTPGSQTNRIFVLLNGNGLASAVSDDITSVVDITPSYYPRYLSHRPAST